MKQDEINKREFLDLTDEEKKMLHEFLLNIVKNPPTQITEALSRLADMEKTREQYHPDKEGITWQWERQGERNVRKPINK